MSLTVNDQAFVLGRPSFTSRNYCTAGNSSASLLVPAGFEASYLKTEEPSDTAILNTVDPKHTQWYFDFAGVKTTIDTFAIINPNMSPNGKYRFIGSLSAGSVKTPDTLPPNAILTSVNMTGAVGNIDEDIYSPDGLYVGPTILSSDWGLRLGWATPANTPITGYGMAQIVIRAGLFANGLGATNPTTYPKMEVELWESGSLIKVLGERAVSESSQIFIFPFNPTDLAAASLANIEVQIFFSPGVSPSGNQYAKIEAVQLYTEHTVHDYDTGWIDSPLGQFEADLDGVQPTKSLHHLLTDITTFYDIISFNLLLCDDHATYPLVSETSDFPSISGVPVGLIAHPASFTQVGIVVSGAKLSLTIPASSPSFYAIPDVQEIEGETLGGQTYGADRSTKRSTGLIDFNVTREVAAKFFDKMWRAGHSGAFYVAFEPGVEPKYQMLSAFWATLVSVSSPVSAGSYNANGEMLMNFSAEFQEKL